MSVVVVGEDHRTIITLDLDLYQRALKLQQSTKNNWILCAGTLHILFASLHALGKTLDRSGIDTCAIETGKYSFASLRKIYEGKRYKRGVEYHLATSLAIMMMKFKVSFPSEDDAVMLLLENFFNSIKSNDEHLMESYKNLQKEWLFFKRTRSSTSGLWSE